MYPNKATIQSEPQHDYALQLQYVEMGLNENQLLQFAENRNKDYWYGPYEQLALFNFWKTIKDKSEGLMFTTPLEQYTLITCHFTLDEPVESVPMSSEAATENNGKCIEIIFTYILFKFIKCYSLDVPGESAI